MKPPLRVTIACSGLGRARRGYESFADECFNALRRSGHVVPSLLHGPGAVSRTDEHATWLLPVRSPWAQTYAFIRARGHTARQRHEAFTIEQYSFGLCVARHAAKHGTEVILFSESQLGAILGRLRRWFGLRYRTIFSNGGPHPPPFPFCDHVQQLTPDSLHLARNAGVPGAMQSLVPYGFTMPASGSEDKFALRRQLDLPVDRPIVISVAAINRSHKRLDYLIAEVAALGERQPYVLFLGQLDEESMQIKAQAAAWLRLGNYRFATVSNNEIAQYYQASDLFVLTSINEAFGRVLVEAMSHGLPCLVHDYPITRFVLREWGYYADFSAPGELTHLLNLSLQDLPGLDRLAGERQTAVRERFSWDHLLPAYEQMFFAAVAHPL